MIKSIVFALGVSFIPSWVGCTPTPPPPDPQVQAVRVSPGFNANSHCTVDGYGVYLHPTHKGCRVANHCKGKSVPSRVIQNADGTWRWQSGCAGSHDV